MSSEVLISGELFAQMVMSGANFLNNKKSIVDNLNVFPVPDGDTGTNMSMTISSAAKAIDQIEGEKTLAAIAEKISYGALMGARGNSGVILSQVLAGFVEVLRQSEKINVADLKKGFSGGVERAYKAVTNPMEGTILTVVREAAEAIRSYPDEGDILGLFEAYLEAGYKSLARTPELLPVLKQAGVVDAGGQGYLFFIEGMKLAFEGEFVELQKEVSMDVDPDETFNHFFVNPDDIEFQYCTEFLIHGEASCADPTDAIKQYLADKGDCILVVHATPTTKIHVHTNHPGGVMEHCSQYGELDDIKINNMKSQNRALQAKGQQETVHQPYAVIAVCNGDGLENIFRSLGVTHIISGGQTMNPSTEDFLKAIDQADADHIILLPNNKNVIMSAEQACELRSEQSLAVVPTKYLPQGISAMMAFRPDVEIAENVSAMKEMIETVDSGEITNAVRDTSIGDIEIKAGEFLAILNGKIIASCADLFAAVEKIVQTVSDEGKELVTLYAGSDLEEAADSYIEKLEELFPDIEFELHDGGQQVYHFMLSAE